MQIFSFANHFVAMLFNHYLFILVYLFVYLFTKCIIDLICLFKKKNIYIYILLNILYLSLHLFIYLFIYLAGTFSHIFG